MTTIEPYSATKSQHKYTRNNVSVEVFYGDSAEKPFASTIVYIDYKRGKKTGKINLVCGSFVDKVINALHARDMMGVDVYSRAVGLNEVGDIWVEKWKAAKCLYDGMPNAAAMALLRGLRKPVRRSIREGKDGAVSRDRHTTRLIEANLVDIVPPIAGVRRESVMTNMRGYEVLKSWAETKGTFAPFLAAYCPKDWEQNYLADKVLAKISGSSGKYDRPFQGV